MISMLPLQAKLTIHQKREMLDAFWHERPVRCPKHGLLMRGEYVERIFEPQVIFTCPKCRLPDLPIVRDLPGATFPDVVRLTQKVKQVRYSEGHLRTLVKDAQERYSPACPVDNEALIVERMPGKHLPEGYDYAFTCPKCFSWGVWVDSGKVEDVAAKEEKKEGENFPFHDETLALPKRMELAEQLIGEKKLEKPDDKLFVKLFAAMAQTDCTACGYDCEGYAKALAEGKDKDPNLCVPGKDETANLVKNLLQQAGKA